VARQVTPLRHLLEGVVDYAGLFPPAALDLQSAAENYATYVESEQAWMLGSFVAPAGRLAELAPLIPRRQRPWNVSALVGTGVRDDIRAVELFEVGGAGRVGWVEVKASNLEQVRQAREWTPRPKGIYFEIADTTLLDAVRTCGARAKLRTGGLPADAVPKSEVVARFLSAARDKQVPFKCTAGLHRALRSAEMHGFLNVLLASVFAQTAVSNEELLEILDSRSAADFHWEEDGVTWQHYRVTNQQIAQARERGMVSFGSCSFVEPVAELHSLGLL
jgi:hypothetical protein